MQINQSVDGNIIQCFISRDELAVNGLDLSLIEKDENTRNTIIKLVFKCRFK